MGHLEFNHQIGTVTGMIEGWEVHGFHACEHAYLVIGDGKIVCNGWGTGTPVIDRLTAECTVVSGKTILLNIPLTPYSARP